MDQEPQTKSQIEGEQKIRDTIEDYPALADQKQGICEYLLDQQRKFEDAAEEIDTSSFEEVVATLPRWFLVLPLQTIELPVRGRNVLRVVTRTDKDEILHLSGLWKRDLQNSDLLDQRNFGENSLVELSRSLIDEARALKKKHVAFFCAFLSTAHFLKLGNSNFSLTEYEGMLTERPQLSPSDSTEREKEHRFTPDSLQDAVQAVFDRQDQEAVQMLLERWREWNPPRSYGRIGETHGVTDTRAWQRISDVKEKLEKELGGELESRLKTTLESRDEPLKVHFLGVENRWFSGFADRLAFLANVVEKLTSDDISILLVQGQRVVTRGFEEEWEDLRDDTIQYLSEERNRRKLTREDAKILVENKAYGSEIPELADPLWEEVQGNLYFGQRGGNIDTLLAVGNNARAAVKAVLKTADQPLNLSSIVKRCMEEYDFSISRGAARDHASDLGVRYGRSSYGTWEHFPLDEEDQQQVLNLIHDVVTTVDKQWHARELLDMLEGEKPALAEPLDKYLLGSILSRSDRLRPIGRMLWIQEGSGVREEPIKIADAVIAVLENAGETLSRSEIRDKIEKHRGLGAEFNPDQSERIVRVGGGEWGLVERDLNLSQEEIQNVARVLRVALEKFGRGLHHSELPHILEEIGIASDRDLPSVGIMEHVGSQPGFDENNKYLYLSDWNNSRR